MTDIQKLKLFLSNYKAAGKLIEAKAITRAIAVLKGKA